MIATLLVSWLLVGAVFLYMAACFIWQHVYEAVIFRDAYAAIYNAISFVLLWAGGYFLASLASTVVVIALGIHK